ncbi:redoxin domain-containing protein [Domibacillus aminovorans]|uniref:Thiol-disulfide oxidoreductase n=1 Tax=Domibacillus aminovorans TaxID=29332 RepID=A0A177L2G1_9BACI|nr:redoxin domain-containing protein [Domibacillus aminovorans]OAH59527.1 thiol-disulfide oxidoreductase [Domibacillus aminovorans]
MKYFILFWLALLIGVVLFNLYSDKEVAENNKAGAAAVNSDNYSTEEGGGTPDFKVQTMDGKEVKLSDYKGKKVFLNFWTTWCPPCKEEMPNMQTFYRKKPANVEILAVNIEESNERVNEFAKEYQLTFPILLDKDGDVSKTYDVYTIPTTFVLNEEGIIHQKIIGPMDENMMNGLIKE